MNYQTAYERANRIAMGFVGLKLHNEVTEGSESFRFVGIFSKNRVEWLLTDLACMLSNVASVALYDTLGADSSKYIIRETELSTIFCSSDKI